MQAVPMQQAHANFRQLADTVLANSEPQIVVDESGKQVVVMPLDDFNCWQETSYLLSNPANAAHLRQSLEELHDGRFAEQTLVVP